MNPTLVVMAAGIGSRYGGLKQIESVGPRGEILLDYSVYDALRAGFDKVVFIIKKETENLFREKFGRRIEKRIETEYVYQNITDFCKLDIARTKPWGTGHAILCCKNVVNGPFSVINADDFYGAGSFDIIAKYLNNLSDTKDLYNYCMVGFELKKTITEYGYVSRGICHVDEENNLIEITERPHVEKKNGEIVYIEGGQYFCLPKNAIASMNFWGFEPSIFSELENRFPKFLEKNKNNLEKAEFYIPSVVDELIKEKSAKVKVLPGKEHWYGITYKEDKQTVSDALRDMIRQGKYPDNI